MRTLGVAGVFFIVCLLIASTVLRADADEIKDRMKQRLPVIIQLKQQGFIGENAEGYLEFVSSKKVNEDVVASENSDRKAVYSIIAKQQGVPVEKVGELRAVQIVQKASPGEYLKKSDGTWYRK